MPQAKIWSLAVLLLAVLLLPGVAPAQSDIFATITGTVTLSDGTDLPGAVIKAENQSTGFELYQVTNSQGHYTIQDLPAGGPYRVVASLEGFNTQIRQNINLRRGQTLQLDFQLSPHVIQKK
ncbi:MAG: carboxypeptidase-like regulatory domain-containing protein [Desulfarculaceae bacterium]|nr:carboxypeptidase-like regulatory domain-containing protein [Desulfarculaceae bacterium]MCF8073579.1 carboxypeptidase-like regulatory domain-containing protein [Desulfarculaceae bacterium]MCF8103101.1 carboxypeptidase-like regulatory domain-containing protein [Desulfarculaceae bacterium]MCF8115705.1 carboxypeptidase-like regulatory domain-containing protein [Desulfarculaceae bacterium]